MSYLQSTLASCLTPDMHTGLLQHKQILREHTVQLKGTVLCCRAGRGPGVLH